MGKFIDLKGKSFDRLLVVDRVDNAVSKSGRSTVRWLCECECGNKVIVNSSSLTSGHTKSCGCYQKDRAREENRKTHDEFVAELKDKYGDEYSVLGKYINNRIPVTVRHNVCGNEWDVTGSNILRGHGCPQCSAAVLKTTDYFKQQVADLVKSEYTVLGKYVGANEKILMRHNECGNEYTVSPSGFLRGNRCPRCKRSLGEEKIEDLLIRENIQYVREHRFDDCVYKAKLKFDFYLPKANVCIEFDGQQHYEPIEAFGGEEGLMLTQLRDSIKDNYCRDSGIKMVRIPYKYINLIEDILIEEKIIERKCLK